MTDDTKIHIDELPHGMLEGFLAEYWRTGADMPRVRGLAVIYYYLKRGVANVSALPGSAAISVLSIAVSLFVFAGLLLVLENVGSVLSRLGTTLSVVAYIKDDTDPALVNDFVRELESNSRVRAVKFLSKNDALDGLRQDFGKRGRVLDGLEDENPLPASVDIVLQSDELGVHSVDQILGELKNKPFVEELSYGTEWVEKVARVLRGFRAMSLAALGIVLALVVTLIANTIKLVLYLRRDEISVMQLVGASDNFVKIPFVLAGLLQGMIGGLLSLVVLKAAFVFLSRNVGDATVLGVIIPAPAFLGVHGMLSVLCLGLIVGGVGSFFAVNRYMKV